MMARPRLLTLLVRLIAALAFFAPVTLASDSEAGSLRIEAAALHAHVDAAHTAHAFIDAACCAEEASNAGCLGFCLSACGLFACDSDVDADFRSGSGWRQFNSRHLMDTRPDLATPPPRTSS